MTAAAPPRQPRLEDLEDLEALIEEARRRARRRRFGCGTALLLAGAALGLYFGAGRGGGGGGRANGSGNAEPTPSASSRAQEARQIAQVGARNVIVEAGLVAPGLGWAMNGLGLWWTRDGGAHWRVMTPPQVASAGDVVARVVDVAAADDRHVWISAADLQGNRVVNGATRHMAIERTADGGKTWRSSIPPGCYGCGGASLSFVDARTGFALTAAQPKRWLFRTSDGGASWQRVAGDVPFVGPIRFLDARSGWAVSDPARTIGPSQSVPVGGGVVYRTRDGGRHWSRVAFTAPPAYRGQPATASLPRFFGTSDGVVAVRFRDRAHAQHLVAYVTHDGGDSWTAHPAPGSADLRAYSWGFPEGIPFSAATAQSWFLFVGPSLYSTLHAGRTWSVTQTSAPKPPRVWDVGFTSPLVGWAIFAEVVDGPRAGAALVRTQDGGHRWIPVAPS